MCWPLRYLTIGAVGFFALGCSEKAEGPPTGPNFHTGLTKSSGCDLQHVGQLANSYFKPPRQQTVKDYVDALAASTLYSFAAKDNGFNIMQQMDAALNTDVPTTAGDGSVGSDLINHLLLCMYNPSNAPNNPDLGAYPASFPDTFTVALTPSATGAFAHRASGTSPVYARSATSSFGFSAIAPDGTWGIAAPNVNTPSRVVLYGRPATTTTGGVTSFDPKTYDWRTLPHNATFNPDIVIAVCENATNNTLMLNEVGVAVLAFQDAGFLAPPACSSSSTALLEGNQPFQLASRLIGFGSHLLSPTPLMAAVLNPGGVGGRSSKCCSKVGFTDVPSVNVSLSTVPSVIQVNAPPAQRFSLTVTTRSANGDLVNGSNVTLTTSTNNGTGTFIRSAATGSCSSGVIPQGVTSGAGTVELKNLCFTSTGNVFIIATATAQRGTISTTGKSNKINVKP